MWWNLILGPVMEVVGKAVDKLVPDIAGREKIKLEMMQEMQRMDFAAIEGQLKINFAEAQHASIFVAGWRPFIGWTCGSAFAWQFVIQPFFTWGMLVVGKELPPVPVLDIGPLLTVLGGMLGLGALRTVEKVKEVARDKVK